MKLNRREFLRATGLAGLLATFGIELPEMEAAEALPIITEAVVSPDCGMEASVQAPQLPLVDLTGLRNVSIEVYRSMDIPYGRRDDDFPVPVYGGPARWEASILAHKRKLDAIGLFPQRLHDLMRTERLYRFAVPLREQRFEGLGILHYLRYDEGFATGPRIVVMKIRGAGPLLDVYP